MREEALRPGVGPMAREEESAYEQGAQRVRWDRKKQEQRRTRQKKGRKRRKRKRTEWSHGHAEVKRKQTCHWCGREREAKKRRRRSVC